MKRFLDGNTPISLHIQQAEQNEQIRPMKDVNGLFHKSRKITLFDVCFSIFLIIGYAGVIHWLITFIEGLK